MFHKHAWTEVQRTYTPPVTGLTKFNSYDMEIVKQVLFGFTAVTYKCTCGRRSQDTLLGNVTK